MDRVWTSEENAKLADSQSGAEALSPVTENVRRAAEISGGIRGLSGCLSEAEDSLSFWLGGQVNIPERAFLKAVDLVLKDNLARAAQDRRESPRDEQAATQEQEHSRFA